MKISNCTQLYLAIQRLRQWSRQRPRSDENIHEHGCSREHGKLSNYHETNGEDLSLYSVFKELLPPNVCMSIRAPSGDSLELSCCGHKVAFQVPWQQENILETLLDMEITWHIFAFLRGRAKGRE